VTRVNWIKTIGTNWLRWHRESRKKRERYLEDRLVYCADCDRNRRLMFLSGSLACSACGSGQWMFVSAGIVSKFKDFDEKAVEAQLAVARSVRRPQKEVFPERSTGYFSKSSSPSFLRSRSLDVQACRRPTSKCVPAANGYRRERSSEAVLAPSLSAVFRRTRHTGLRR
jgi:hypothetical protein